MNVEKTIVSIDQLYLDPNNYRFVDAESYTPVDDAKAMDERVQRHVRGLLLGHGNENISDLIKSFKTNGFLNLELIQVRELSGGKYLVLEGNRRVATLKLLYERYKAGEDVGLLGEEDFLKISVQVIQDDLRTHLVAMGLHHITGKKRWNPLNQARLIYDLVNKYNMDEDKACDALGCSKMTLKKSLRSLALIHLYEKSDYGDQFRSDMFSIFEEAMKSPSIKAWLGWDDEIMGCLNKERMEYFFQWISTTTENTDDTEEIVNEDYEDESDKEERLLDPIITKSSEIRLLSKFINDEKAVERMVEQRSVAEGYAFSEVVNKGKVSHAVAQIQTQLHAISSNSGLLRADDKNTMYAIAETIIKMLPAEQSVGGRILAELKYDTINTQFAEININKFRGIHGLHLTGLRRINLFVGANNSGKTTLLEAVFLLTQMNDAYKLVDIEKLRGRIEGEAKINWLLENVPDSYQMSGVFNEKSCQVSMKNESEKSTEIDKQGYLSTIETKASAGNSNQSYVSKIRIYDDRQPEVIYKEAFVLCRSAFTSPYRSNRKLLVDAHGKVVENGKMGELLQFIKEYFDANIQSIDLTSVDGLNRFIVKTKDGSHPMELTKYGEGLQRIFEISLFVINCAGGCLMIDEIDSAIHKSLLVEFTNFVSRLAEEYNVQLFVTTHSKECVDAFVKMQNINNLMTYRLEREADKFVVKQSAGEELSVLVDGFDFDIR